MQEYKPRCGSHPRPPSLQADQKPAAIWEQDSKCMPWWSWTIPTANHLLMGAPTNPPFLTLECIRTTRELVQTDSRNWTQEVWDEAQKLHFQQGVPNDSDVGGPKPKGQCQEPNFSISKLTGNGCKSFLRPCKAWVGSWHRWALFWANLSRGESWNPRPCWSSSWPELSTLPRPYSASLPRKAQVLGLQLERGPGPTVLTNGFVSQCFRFTFWQ